MTPRFIATILEAPVVWVFARILLTFMYWYAGIGFLLDFHGTEAIMGSYGLPAWMVVALTIFVELVGSALVIWGRLAWLGAGMLGVFTLLTIPLVHHFWTMTGAEAIQARLESEEHLSVCGGLVLVAIFCHLHRRRG